jgi:hypothetical protein
LRFYPAARSVREFIKKTLILRFLLPCRIVLRPPRPGHGRALPSLLPRAPYAATHSRPVACTSPPPVVHAGAGGASSARRARRPPYRPKAGASGAGGSGARARRWCTTRRRIPPQQSELTGTGAPPPLCRKYMFQVFQTFKMYVVVVSY